MKLRPLSVLLFFIVVGCCFSQNHENSSEIATDRSYVFVELGGRKNPNSFGGTLGISYRASENLSTLFGLSLLASEAFDDTFGGASLGIRLHAASRISPFVGVGVFGGYSKERVSSNNDGKDNDKDGFVDEADEKDEVTDNVLFSGYPELGVHIWATETLRISCNAKYFITTEGRGLDFWSYNLVQCKT